MVSIELCRFLINGIHDDQSGGCGFSCDHRHAEGVGQEPFSETDTLLTPINGKPGDEDHANWIGRQTSDELYGSIGPLHRAHGQGDVADDAIRVDEDKSSS